MEDARLERFYVYKSLHSDESWGAVVMSGSTSLPNCSFLMKVYAYNETAAIARGRELYDKIHRYDSQKANLKHFALKAFESVSKEYSDYEEIAEEAMKLAEIMHAKYEKYCEDMENEDGV